MSDYNQNSNILVNNYFGNIEGCSKEWLNLRFGGKEDLVAADQHFLLNSTYKIFSCNYCNRKFYSSQALGGHQNAHRREREALRRYQSERQTTMVDLPVNKPMIRSLGVQLHSMVHKPSRDSKPMVAGFNEANMGSGLSQLPEDIRFNWPGGFRMASEFPKQPSELLKKWKCSQVVVCTINTELKIYENVDYQDYVQVYTFQQKYIEMPDTQHPPGWEAKENSHQSD